MIAETGSTSELEYVEYDRVYGQGIEDMLHRIPSIEKVSAAIGWQPERTLDRDPRRRHRAREDGAGARGGVTGRCAAVVKLRRMIRILYSADYELYLGENFLPETEVVVEPTRALLAAAERVNVPFTLFVDVACLWRYRDDGNHEFADVVENQLKGALQRGHDVQACLHPHWLYAERVNGRWRAPLDTFLVGALEDPPRCSPEPRPTSRSCSAPSIRTTRCIAFRAGNYGIQPQYERVFAALVDTGYEVDSSVVPGLVLQGRRQQGRLPRLALAGEGAADLRHLRGSRRDGAVRPAGRECGGSGSRPRGGASRAHDPGDSSGAREPSLFSRVFRLDPLELGPSAHRLQKITRRYLRRAGKDAEFSFSSHPKAVGEAELEALVAYHEWLDRNYDVEALTFRELAVSAEGRTLATGMTVARRG